ncbi:MAG: hypothetical protein HY698_09740, partial [Deltaproteobacteria bacterium]|nr:hypothetical protein [Deltaproteobacteria bacterium]
MHGYAGFRVLLLLSAAALPLLPRSAIGAEDGLLVESPVQGEVVSGRMRVVARCPNDPRGCSRVEIAVGQDKLFVPLLSREVPVLAMEIDVPRGELLRVRATDHAGASYQSTIRFFRDHSSDLIEIDRVNGLIVDVTDDRILYWTGNDATAPGRLVVKHRVTGDELELLDGASYTWPDRYMPKSIGHRLTPDGAFLIKDGIWEHRAGRTRLLSPGASWLIVKGNYAAWDVTERDEDGFFSGYTIHLYDSSSGNLNRLAVPVHYGFDLSPHGEIAYAARDGSIRALRPGSVEVRLTEGLGDRGIGFMDDSPITDGVNVLFNRSHASGEEFSLGSMLAVHTPGGDEFLTATTGLNPNEWGYQARDGWIAFLDYRRQVHLRAPDAEIVQVTNPHLGSMMSLEMLAPNGELAFDCDSRAGSAKLLYSGGLLQRIGSPAGHSFFVNGRWLIALGRVLYALPDARPAQPILESCGLAPSEGSDAPLPAPPSSTSGGCAVNGSPRGRGDCQSEIVLMAFVVVALAMSRRPRRLIVLLLVFLPRSSWATTSIEIISPSPGETVDDTVYVRARVNSTSPLFKVCKRSAPGPAPCAEKLDSPGGRILMRRSAPRTKTA